MTVGIDDKALNDNVTSFLSRELRSLKDVELVRRDDPQVEFVISVAGMPLVTKGGTTTGFALSVTVYSPMTQSALDIVLSNKANPGNIKELSEIFLPYVRIQSNDVYVGGTDDIRKQCEMIVVSFDRKVLQAARDSYARYLKTLKQ